MFYEPSRGHGLPHDPFKAIVAPRPIGWISSLGRDGSLNLAPYSFFNAISGRPPLVMFSSEGRKDSLANIEQMGEFVANLVSRDLVEQMNASSVDAPRGVSEFDYAGLTPEPSRLVKPPRVKEAHAALECKVTGFYEPKGIDGNTCGRFVTFAEVVGVFIDDAALDENGLFDVVRAGNVSRLGYRDYASIDATFQMRRHVWEE